MHTHPFRRLATVAAAAAIAACGQADASPEGFDELAQESLAQIDGTLSVPGLQGEVEVVRDEFGVAHIYADDMRDLFFAQGYVQAQDRLWQIDMWRRINEGRLAEILGPEALEHDRLARLIRFRGDWDEEFARYHPDGREIFQAFADGVNAYIEQVGDDLPVEYRLTGIRPLPWTPEASTGRVATALPLGEARSELSLARRIAQRGLAEVEREESEGVRNWVPLELPPGVDYSLITEEVVRSLSHFESDFPEPELLPEYRRWSEAVASLNLGAIEDSPGSNNWVVSGDLTATGEVLLANDPHRGVTNPSLRYLVHLNAPGYSVIGATEPSIPGVAIGHNGKIGWGLTIVGTDQADVFIERLNPENLDQALWEGEWYPLETIVDTIPVKGGEPRIVEHRYSRHGPVFYTDSVNHVAYAVRSTANEPGTGGYLAALRLAEADTCHQFMDAMAYWAAPSENMICGDTEGNIAWLAAALTPDRTEGWHGRLPVPGTGGYAWEGFRSHMELPHEFNPERGWIGTANNDIQPEGYFPPIMFRTFASARNDRLREMFEGADDLTVEDFMRMQMDAQYPWWDEERPLLTGWTSEDPDVEWARGVLERWDGLYDRSAVAPALHNVWRRRLDDEARDASTPPARRRALAEAALAEAVAEVEEDLGADRSQWRWGRIHRSEFPHSLVAAYDLPAVERDGGGGAVIAATGATFREIIDFSNFDNSRATSTPGQSGQPGSPFYGNLLPLWGAEEYFPLLYSREAVEGRSAHRLTLRPGGS